MKFNSRDKSEIMSNATGRIIFSTETLESLSKLSTPTAESGVTTDMMMNDTSSDEGPYNGEESENRLDLFPTSSFNTSHQLFNSTLTPLVVDNQEEDILVKEYLEF